MSRLSWIFLESPAALGVGLVAPLFLLLVYWRRSGNVRPLAIGAALALVLVTIQAVVVTPREHAVRVLDGIEKELVASHTGALEAALAPDFRFEQLDRGEFIALVQQELGQVRLHWIERWHLEVLESTGDQFTVRADYQTEVGLSGITYAPRSAWTLAFVRTGDRWLISGIRCLHIDGNRDMFRV